MEIIWVNNCYSNVWVYLYFCIVRPGMVSNQSSLHLAQFLVVRVMGFHPGQAVGVDLTQIYCSPLIGITSQIILQRLLSASTGVSVALCEREICFFSCCFSCVWIQEQRSSTSSMSSIVLSQIMTSLVLDIMIPAHIEAALGLKQTQPCLG